ncbi:hypothetical protein CC2G_003332 [Coprinopsis cinerea AmutBmut pab1-1]|nr:hypothetical protein CC2G_003332 [Coprinopsis cinerea AmutBmut pab1-1]
MDTVSRPHVPHDAYPRVYVVQRPPTATLHTSSRNSSEKHFLRLLLLLLSTPWITVLDFLECVGTPSAGEEKENKIRRMMDSLGNVGPPEYPARSRALMS